MDIFEFKNYKEFVRKRIAAMPNRGRGELLRIATHLRIQSSRVSHIFRGSVNLTPEQACALCQYLGLSKAESEYFLTLVNIERAGSQELRSMLVDQAAKLRERAKELVNRLPPEQAFSDEQKAIFYSSWYYSGIRLATSVPGNNSVDAISQYLALPRETVRTVVDFLLSTGICTGADGSLQMGSRTTHLERSSPLVLRHHANWRLRALAKHEALKERDLAYTCPVSIRRDDQAKVREMIVVFIEQFLKKVVASDPPETLACLNIDWFGIND